MAAKRTEYQIVGRYMSGKEVTGYHLQSIDTGKSGRYTKEQVCWLVGRDQITNCTGQIYQDKVLLRGKGMSLEDLPVQYDDGDTRNMDRVGKVRKGTDTASAMEQYLIVGTIKSGRNTVGYVIQNAGCGIKKLKRQQVIELAAAGKIGNARVQNYNGKVLLRGVNCNLDELPSENVEVKPVNSTATNTKPVDTKPINTKTVNTIRVINIPQLIYHGNSKFEVGLVDFGVHNPTLNRDKLEIELNKFKADANRIIGHEFNNTDEILETSLQGKNCLITFDDPYYSTISDYIRASKNLGAKILIDVKSVDLVDSYSDIIEGDMLNKAKTELNTLLNTYKPVSKSVDANTNTPVAKNTGVTAASTNKANIDLCEVSCKMMEVVNKNTGSDFILSWDDNDKCKFYDRKYADESDYTGVEVIVHKRKGWGGYAIVEYAEVELHKHYGGHTDKNTVGKVSSIEETKECTIQIINDYKKYVYKLTNDETTKQIIAKKKELREKRIAKNMKILEEEGLL